MPKPKRTRRPRGYGNVTERRPGVYRIRFSVAGERHSRDVEARSKRDAENQAAIWRAELEQNAKRRSKGFATELRFTDLLERYEVDEFPNLSPGGRDSYRDSLKVFQIFFVEERGNPRLGQIDDSDIFDFKAWRRGYSLRPNQDGVSAHTVARDLRVLQRIFSVALKRRIVERNPVLAVEKPSADRRDYCILNQDEYNSLINAGYDLSPVTGLYILFLGETGCRSMSEALHVQWRDLDLDDGFVEIVSGRDGHRTKSGKSRHVPLTKRLIRALRQHAELCRDVEYDGGVSAWVFHHLRTRRNCIAGERIKSLRSSFERAKQQAGVPESLRIHDLRHRRATTWLGEAKSPMLVKEALGHSSMAVTEGYAHLAKQHLRALVE